MDKLSQEIIDIIVSFVPRRIGEAGVPEWEHGTLPYALPNLATVSRRFQRAVERRTFKWLSIKTSGAELDEFERIFNRETQRRRNLEVLYIHLLVLPYPSEAIAEAVAESETGDYFETDQDRQAEREALTAPLRRVWNFIATWSENTTHSGRYHLHLYAVLSPDAREAERDGYRPFAFSLLDLAADAERFPALPCIRVFRIASDARHWNPRVAAVLTASMPNLEGAEWGLEGAAYDWGRYYSIDKQYRDGLAESSRITRLPPSLGKFSCNLKPPSNCDPGQVLPRFIEGGAHDPVSCAVRELTRHCVDISLNGPFHPSLFDPPGSGPAAEQQPCWQHTTNLRVEMALGDPDGSWLFRPETPAARIDVPQGSIDCTLLPPGYGENTVEAKEEAEEYYEDHRGVLTPPVEYESYRVAMVPDDEKLNALLTAFARGCARMPALEHAALVINFENDDNWPFEATCVSPSFRMAAWGMEISDSWRVYLHVNQWRPTGATISHLENVGIEKNGRPSIIEYLQWGYFFN